MAKIEDINLKNRIYKNIRDLILNKQIKQGERIPEADIAKSLNVSKTPVREAVRRLAWEGLITIEPNKSATVRCLSESTIRDLAAVRWQHDKLNIPLVVYNGSNKEFDKLQEFAEKCYGHNERGDLYGRHKYDAKFHMYLYEIGGNQILCEVHRHLELLVSLWQVYNVLDPSDMKEGLMQHFDIIEGLRKRDADSALKALYEHYQGAYGVDFEKIGTE